MNAPNRTEKYEEDYQWSRNAGITSSQIKQENSKVGLVRFVDKRLDQNTEIKVLEKNWYEKIA